MGVFAIWIEHALPMTIDRPEGRDARELDRAATLGRARYQFGCCKNDRQAAFGRRDGVNEVHNSLAQRRQPYAAGQIDGLGKTAIPGHNATPQQNLGLKRTAGRFVPVELNRFAACDSRRR